MKIITRKFNLIEIALALGILGLGVTSIISLFPIGFQEIKNSIGQNYSSLAANDIISEISYIGFESWGDFIQSDDIPEAKPNISDESTINPNDNNLEVINGSEFLYVRENDIDGLFLAKITSDNGNIVDFAGQVLIWKSPPSPIKTDTGYINYDSSYTQGAGINLEISWPAQKPYREREIKTYYFEVFKND